MQDSSTGYRYVIPSQAVCAGKLQNGVEMKKIGFDEKCDGSIWIPACAGMTVFACTHGHHVIPANAGIQEILV
jgi:hypothetical protein